MSRSLLSATLLFTCLQVYADGDGGLYEDVAPDGSTFVRLINASSSDTVNGKINGAPVAALGFCQVSPYMYFPANKMTVDLAGNAKEHAFTENAFYSVVLNDGNIDVIEDKYFNNKRKALISLYNFVGSKPLSLTVKQGKVKVVENVAHKTHGDREINPVSMPFEVTIDDNVVEALAKQSLERGNIYGVFACGGKDAITTSWTAASVESPQK